MVACALTLQCIEALGHRCGIWIVSKWTWIEIVNNLYLKDGGLCLDAAGFSTFWHRCAIGVVSDQWLKGGGLCLCEHFITKGGQYHTHTVQIRQSAGISPNVRPYMAHIYRVSHSYWIIRHWSWVCPMLARFNQTVLKHAKSNWRAHLGLDKNMQRRHARNTCKVKNHVHT